MEVRLMSGTLLDSGSTNDVASVKGFLGADRTVALRWQGKVAEIARSALLTVESDVRAQITPTVLKYTSQFHYDVVQGHIAQLKLALPTDQALTRLAGDGIRDWHASVEADCQILTVEFIKPVERNCALTLYSEQTVANLPATVSVNPPQPVEIDRESGSLSVATEDALVEVASLSGLRQMNAPSGALAAYRFSGRPFTLSLRLNRIKPVISVVDQVSARLEETRLIVMHKLGLSVDKAGIYALDLQPQSGFSVAEVRGDGIEDWRSEGATPEGKVLKISFAVRVLGERQIEVQLEKALKPFPDNISLESLHLTDAEKETARIGVGCTSGLQIRTAAISGLREIPARALRQSRTGFQPAPAGASPANMEPQTTTNPIAFYTPDQLAYTSDQADWKLTLTTQRLAPRVVADVFNLVTIGDGIVGGSATIRYSIVNQGVQEFRVKVPAFCRNVEFTGPNIRRKEPSSSNSLRGKTSDANTNDVVWTIGLQDKAWSGYTLVVTYDYPFDSTTRESILPVGGIHGLDIERETGSIALTTAASLKITSKAVTDTLRRVDETELPSADRSLITRAVVLAYQYGGNNYDLSVDVKRFAEADVLNAVADRTQITSVLTESGEMLTQATFMVKNNQKQYQRFLLPKDASLWSCYVNNQPAKPGHDGKWILVPLPRDANRDQAFAVDIVYAEKKSALPERWSKSIELAGPRTDVPNTYAEWQLFVPPHLPPFSFRRRNAGCGRHDLSTVRCVAEVFAILFAGSAGGGRRDSVHWFLAFLVIALAIGSARRGWNGFLTVLAVLAILGVLGAMLLPALAKAKSKAQRISSVNNLKQIGLAAILFAGDNDERLPISFEEMINELATDKITYDPATGQRYTYLGAGMSRNELKPDSVLAYSPIVDGACNVLLADGSVQMMTAAQFGQLSQRGLVQRISPGEAAQQNQDEAVRRSQFTEALRRPAGANASQTRSAGEPVPIAPTFASATVSGLRSIRIELPQTGQPFLFTKVLNIGDEPLSIRARLMPMHTFQAIQMTWQVAAFLLGILVFWWQWCRERPRSLLIAVAVILIFGSVGSLLIQWRALHDALIIGFPVVTLAIIAFLVWKYWPRSSESGTETSGKPPMSGTSGLSGPPVVASILLAFFLGANSTPAASDAAVRTAGNASLVSAEYSGTVNDRVAEVEAVLQLSTTEANQLVPLFSDQLAVQQFKVRKGNAELIRDGDKLAVRLEDRGDTIVEIKFLAKVSGDVTKPHLVFGIPPALSTRVAFVLDESEAEVEFPTAISFQRTLEPGKTRVEAVIGSADHLDLAWTPRVKRAAEMAVAAFCESASLVTFGGGAVSVRSVLDYRLTQGELTEVRVQLPAGQRLLHVEGDGINTWEVSTLNRAQSRAGFQPAQRALQRSRWSVAPAAPARAGKMPALLYGLENASPISESRGESKVSAPTRQRFGLRQSATAFRPAFDSKAPEDGRSPKPRGESDVSGTENPIQGSSQAADLRNEIPLGLPAVRRHSSSADNPILIVHLLKGISSSWKLTVKRKKRWIICQRTFPFRYLMRLVCSVRRVLWLCGAPRSWGCRSSPRPNYSGWTLKSSPARARTRPARC